jgi:hypothetical protein
MEKGRAGLPLESVKRLGCDGSIILVVEDEAGNPLKVSRRTRTIPTALRRALEARDRHCRFPGCRHKRFLEVHHIVHWANDGETSLDNTLLLCTHHHRLGHEGGFRIEKNYLGRWYFVRPDGRGVPSCGYRPEDMLDEDVHPSAEGFSGSLENPSAEGWRHMAGRLAAAGPP